MLSLALPALGMQKQSREQSEATLVHLFNQYGKESVKGLCGNPLCTLNADIKTLIQSLTSKKQRGPILNKIKMQLKSWSPAKCTNPRLHVLGQSNGFEILIKIIEQLIATHNPQVIRDDSDTISAYLLDYESKSASQTTPKKGIPTLAVINGGHKAETVDFKTATEKISAANQPASASKLAMAYIPQTASTVPLRPNLQTTAAIKAAQLSTCVAKDEFPNLTKMMFIHKREKAAKVISKYLRKYLSKRKKAAQIPMRPSIKELSIQMRQLNKKNLDKKLKKIKIEELREKLDKAASKRYIVIEKKRQKTPFYS